ncbi:phage tail protein, partial [Rhizobium sp. Root483D2]|uniref:phage tail protein n=1 Tax=Rhizobium sp. Root483D2 TaxID=1736545 RepID=UPI0019101819
MAVFSTAAVAGALAVAETSFLATVSTFALNAAVGVGLNLAVAQLTKVDQPQAGGVRGKLEAGGDVPRSFVLGTRAVSGSLQYANTWGKSGKTPNAYLTQVIQLSDAPIKGVTAMWVNGSPVTINTADTSYGDWGFPVSDYETGDGGNNMWVKVYDGTQTVADPFLVNTVSSEDRPYASTRVGRGCAYAIVTSQIKDSFFSGFPSFRFEVAGMRLYDPSRDSTRGGVGSHRLNNRATWGGDGDDFPAVQAYNLLLGITYDSAWLYGLQTLKAASLPVAHWIARINQCRAKVSGPDGLETQYMTGIEISVDTELSATIDAILKGAHGKLIEVGGVYKLQMGEPGAPVLPFTDADILSTEQQKGKPFASLANSINGVTASYPEPTKAWNTQPAPPLYNASFEARDGKRRLTVDLPLGTVSRFSQVQRIMTSALAEARRERRHTITLPPWACLLEPGDVVEWNSERESYATKKFRVEGVADKANL